MYKADQAAEVRGVAPGVETYLMLDGVIEGYGSYEDAVAAASPEPAEGSRSGQDMLYSSGTTGQPKGIARPFEAIPLEEAPDTIAGVNQLLFGATQDTVYLSPAPLYHAAPCAQLALAPHPPDGDGALRRRGVPRPDRAPQVYAQPGRCRRCSSAC